MKKLLFILFMAVLSSSMAQTSVTFTGTKPLADSVILDFVRQIDDAWNTRDIDRFAELFAEDCDVNYITLGEQMKTRKEVYEGYGGGFKAMSPEVRHLTYPKEILWLSSDLVMGTGYTDIVADSGDGSAPRLLKRHNGLMVFRITEEGPKILVLRAWTESLVVSR